MNEFRFQADLYGPEAVTPIVIGTDHESFAVSIKNEPGYKWSRNRCRYGGDW